MYLVVELFVTILLDIVFLVLHWVLNLEFPAVRFSGDELFTKVIGFLMLASIALRVVILVNVYGYKEIQEVKTHYMIFGMEFELNRRLFEQFERIEKG